ncbi:hypothetical protein C1646_749804 [Rhizophagus diaphanus]|nr:hypothetical protein C1646_749804 [Rhizophagus diaphanus] [Rhizophagus sp. MUCL 43196]
MAEQSEIMHEYTTLNDDFTKRLKDDNRKQDEREVGKKRPMLESPSPRKPSQRKKEDKKTRIKKKEELGNWHLIIEVTWFSKGEGSDSSEDEDDETTGSDSDDSVTRENRLSQNPISKIIITSLSIINDNRDDKAPSIQMFPGERSRSTTIITAKNLNQRKPTVESTSYSDTRVINQQQQQHKPKNEEQDEEQDEEIKELINMTDDENFRESEQSSGTRKPSSLNDDNEENKKTKATLFYNPRNLPLHTLPRIIFDRELQETFMKNQRLNL